MMSEPYKLLKDRISRYCNLNNKDWELLRDIFVIEYLEKGELFGLEGKKADKFGFVYSGCLRMFYNSESGVDITKHFICAGEFFVGAINYYDKSLSSIQALTKCEVLVVNYRRIEELAASHKFIFEFKNNLVSHYVTIKQKRELEYLSLQSIDRYKLFLNNFPNLVNVIPLHYIANYLGISTTQLSRVRKKLFVP